MKSVRLLCIVLLLTSLSFLGCTKPNVPSSAADSSPSPTPSSDTAVTGSGSSAASNSGSQNEAQAPAPPATAPIIIPAGKTITVRLAQPLSSKESQEGQSFSGTVAEPVVAHGQTVIQRGAAVHGTVVTAKAMGHFKGGALLQLRLTSVSIKGERRPVDTAVWSRTLAGKGKRSAVAIGGGAGLGAALGGIFGGGKGAAIGAVAGAGAGTAGAAYTGNKEIQLPAESTLQFQLKHSIQVQ